MTCPDASDRMNVFACDNDVEGFLIHMILLSGASQLIKIGIRKYCSNKWLRCFKDSSSLKTYQ